ncbi:MULTISPECIES: DUF1648 domain-containing protein [unclassified Actinomyces]|uniref:DUF1648 domain-containing protein n=1 Tax=unclassified Actinomyces TaxID=2609248 RepID=UPI002017C3AB|nr:MULTISPECIES: DUF1648 domain-containing protein [unclassified Actinomyces]MCL3776606.1 DUF1648 domain-containing protein [Actinomyces sp. AC-20-1]MCL3790111.1 DUF1648 domain-containing protein [Actinomyces sp. 187325]MCL3792413.1 DUF1648 domain-containing protein [Actinomyces sp. 186855]MCL3793472.1 DUF1648 domain-containing protein [Actinomyces sp. 217892]
MSRTTGTRPAPAVRVRWAWHWGAALVLLSTVVVLLSSYEDLPDPYPVHYGLTGVADSFASKSHVMVLLPVVIGAVLVAAIAVTSTVQARSLSTRPERPVGRYDHLDCTAKSTPESVAVLGPVNLLLAVTFSGVSLLPVVGPLAGSGMMWGGLGLIIAVLATVSVRARRRQRG